MSEFISSWHFSEQQQKAALQKAGQAALSIVDQTYGDGYPHYAQPGSQELSYHNGHHARAVGDTAAKLSRIAGLSPLLCETSRTAGYAHDEKQLLGRGLDEQQSAQWIEQQLARDDIVAPQLRTIASLAVLGTEPTFTNGKLTGQKATEMEFPSRQAETLAKSVASADLGELYTPQGPLLAHQLFREIHGMADPSKLSVEKLTGFQRNQLELLETYRFPLVEAEKALTQTKPQVITYSADVLDKLERGQIDSWQHVIELDKAFAQQLA